MGSGTSLGWWPHTALASASRSHQMVTEALGAQEGLGGGGTNMQSHRLKTGVKARVGSAGAGGKLLWSGEKAAATQAACGFRQHRASGRQDRRQALGPGLWGGEAGSSVGPS